MNVKSSLILFLALALLSGCGQNEPGGNGEGETGAATLFSKLAPEQTGITFSNDVREAAGLNVLDFSFLYNGGGVAIGDINNDDLPDILFTGNMVSSRLYLNRGGLEFEDITESAGLVTEGWITGASMVDIDNDGNLDIYLSVASREEAPEEERTNLLYINNGDNTFTESAAAYGIASTRFTTQAAFLDYNRDGLLDLFLLNHSPGEFSREMGQSIGASQTSAAQRSLVSFDQLYRNNGDGTFTDVSREAGIIEETGYGLGVAVGDLNRDGWPDIYVSNDVAPDDVLYINNGDGTFTDRSGSYLKHTGYAGMGVDIADFNNDSWPDIFQVDMMPEDLEKRKVMSYGSDLTQFENWIRLGHNYSYSKNMLQMSNGLDAEGHVIFSEVGRMAGVSYTDWSWATLFGDYDNDGLKDIMITTGYPVATDYFDFIVEMFEANSSGSADPGRLLQDWRRPELPNYLFRNGGDLRFIDVSEKWGFGELTYAYGAAQADLDNDGDLELVISNLNAPASIFKNNSREHSDSRYLRVKLEGPEQNKLGIGTEVVLTTGTKKQYLYQSPYRGYQSSVDTRLHFGTGDETRIDTLEVFWPDGRYQSMTGFETNQQVTLDYAEAEDLGPNRDIFTSADRRFDEVTTQTGLLYEHVENNFNDYRVQPLLNQQLSRLGPGMAVGDVNGDGLDDLFVGGAAGSPGVLFVQLPSGRFEEANDNQPWLSDAASEDTDALFFDANGDGLQDLYIASGGYEFFPLEDALLDRLYINRGDGRFVRDAAALPRMYTSSSVVTAGDFNGDGLDDIFVGGRLEPLRYPHPARSYILQNDGGIFSDVTETVAPGLVEPGLITDATWIDFNHDGQLDIVTTGVWLPVLFYQNYNGRLQEVTGDVTDRSLRGWCYSLGTGDFNNDGRIDLVAGNLGLNHPFTTSEDESLGLFANDFNNDLTTDLIYTVRRNGLHYPFFGKARLIGGLGFIHERYPTFESIAGEAMTDIFEGQDLDESIRFRADTFASMFFRNNGDGTYSAEQLPEWAQISPINTIVTEDVDEDGNPDLLVAGNIYATHPDIARFDAGNGLWLKGNGNGTFDPVSARSSGFLAPGDVKAMKMVHTSGGRLLVVANNNDTLQVFRIR